jgi:hypothetical protein
MLFFIFMILCTFALLVNGAIFSNRIQRVSAAPQSDDISPEALAQIAALIQEKESRSPVEQKIDSQLIYQIKMSHGQAVANNVTALQTDVDVDTQGKAEVDITATVTDTLLVSLQAHGAEIVSAKGAGIRALVPLDSLESIAALDGVKFVQPKQDAMTSSGSGPEQPRADDRFGLQGNLQPGFSERAARVRNVLTNLLQGGSSTNVSGSPAPTGVGSRSSEGDVTHRANLARGVFHTTGAGITIGVLSNGVANLAASQALAILAQSQSCRGRLVLVTKVLQCSDCSRPCSRCPTVLCDS